MTPVPWNSFVFVEDHEIAPLVLIHAARAGAMSYVGLAAEGRFDADLPIYAINDTFLEQDTSFTYASIEEVATHCRELIVDLLKRRGGTDVSISGWSYGGVCSVALAPMLFDVDITVLSVVCLDSPIGQARHQQRLKASVGLRSRTSDAARA